MIVIPAETEEVYTPISDGQIIFFGGIDLGEDYMYVNPVYAKLLIDEEVEILEWWIATQDNESILQSSDNIDAEKVNINPYEIERDGIYYVVFEVKSESGSVHRIGSSFLIQS